MITGVERENERRQNRDEVSNKNDRDRSYNVPDRGARYPHSVNDTYQPPHPVESRVSEEYEIERDSAHSNNVQLHFILNFLLAV